MDLGVASQRARELNSHSQ